MQANRKRKSETCSVCYTKLNGRKDQVFCGRECQNIHHKETKEAIFYINQLPNKRLRRNCVILEGILTDNVKKVNVHRDTLFEHGFDINSFENERWKGNKRIRHIGPFAFWLLKNGTIQIKKRKKTWITNPKVLRRWEVEFLWVLKSEVVSFSKKELINFVGKNQDLTVIPFVYKTSSRNSELQNQNLYTLTHQHNKPVPS